jgi:hypothetical protein
MRVFTPGDIIGLFQSEKAGGSDLETIGGIVYKVNNEEIILSYNEMHEFESLKQPVTGILLANEITYKRCKIALDCLK